MPTHMSFRRTHGHVRWILLIVIPILALSAAVFVAMRLTRPGVTVTRIAEGPVAAAFYATGTLEPDREYPVKSNMEGIVAEVYADKGDPVEEGQELVVLDVPALKNARDEAVVDYEKAQTFADPGRSPILMEFDDRARWTDEQLANARDDLHRYRALIERGAGSIMEVQQREDKVSQLTLSAETIRRQKAARLIDLRADLQKAHARMETAIDQWKKTVIRAPIDGVVLDRPVPVGTRVPVNFEMARIADVAPARLVMRAAVDEEDRTRLKLGGKVLMTLYSYPDVPPFEGHVEAIYPKADPDRRTFEADIRFNDPPKTLAAGMTGELVFIVLQKDNTTVIPRQAVQDGAVWVVRDGRLVLSDAKLSGVMSVERAEVLSGLSPNDEIVISAVSKLKAGQRVRIAEEIDPRTAASLNKPKVSTAFKAFGG